MTIRFPDVFQIANSFSRNLNGNSDMNYSYLFLLILFAACSNGRQETATPESKNSRPNILYIMLDDLGFSDLACFGSEIATPNIDALAARGQRFAGFRTAPMCGPTRAMMISGNSNHVEGMGRMMNTQEKNARYMGMKGYEEDITDRIVAFPTLLQQAGYFTAVTGKWHLGWEESSKPANHGFDRSWVLRNAAANHYIRKNYGISHPDRRDTVSIYYSNGKEVAYPEGTYSSEWYTDQMLEFLKEAERLNDDQPFFAFLSFTSPHWPLQVPEAYWDKYRGKYNDGYQALMERRVQGLKENGIISADIELPPYPDLENWDNLSEEEQQYAARKMEIFAGMVENADYHIGRLIQYLQESGEYDNTIIVLHSDNGAAAEDLSLHPAFREKINTWNDNSYENMNQTNSFIALGEHWAQACAAPFRKYKQQMYEGGMASPCIIAGKGIPASTTVRREFFTIQDIAPTFLEIAGTSYPKEWQGKEIEPQRGTSILSYVQERASKVHEDDFIFAMEHRRTAFLRKGHWKIANQQDAANNDLFELYNLQEDFSEQRDLSSEQTEVFEDLLAEWEQYKKEVGVVFLEKLD
ncbi:MAG: arylsulfatase [Bacteroidota bacterium]